MNVWKLIRPESWEKFRPALKKMKMSIVIQRYTKKLAGTKVGRNFGQHLRP